MLTRFDDYPCTQTAEPVAASGHRRSQLLRSLLRQRLQPRGRLYFGRRARPLSQPAAWTPPSASCAAVCIRPPRLALAPVERQETRVGPITVEVVEPLSTCACASRERDGIEGDPSFSRARTAPLEEPRFTYRVDGAC